ncbi:Rha family transcriptional regulator [Vallitalea guaymasensis]|uniref:Rha family transcriptional regulator n=1 Tax=Vallitalea guaymasensis TaxID=1185412 RepID=UPI000DE37D30|nr:Rha family transcriptional regulator [Vallitalea guaymasensis]
MNELITKESNQQTLDSREVAEMVDKQHAHLIRDIDNYIIYLSQNPKLDSDDFFKESSYTAGTGKPYKCYNITKKGCEFIAHKLTGQKGAIFTATYINRFHELEQGQALQTIAVPYIDTLQGAKFIADDLKVNEASRILMYNKVCKSYGVDTSFLPVYTEEKITKSATALLKENNVNISTGKFNILLMEDGYLEEKTRPSSKKGGKPKKYKQLTKKGLLYGKNLISPHNQREVQPHYFEDVFMELVNRVMN